MLHALKQIVLFADGQADIPHRLLGERKEDVMESRANAERETCGHCGKRLSFIRCTGCEIPLCQECACFELIGSGCGTVIPAYYCLLCVKDARINPNAVFYS